MGGLGKKGKNAEISLTDDNILAKKYLAKEFEEMGREIKVIDKDGNPVVGAEVTLVGRMYRKSYGPPGFENDMTGTTNKEGVAEVY